MPRLSPVSKLSINRPATMTWKLAFNGVQLKPQSAPRLPRDRLQFGASARSAYRIVDCRRIVSELGERPLVRMRGGGARLDTLPNHKPCCTQNSDRDDYVFSDLGQKADATL